MHTFGVPFAQLCTENFEGARARTLMKNIMYVGTVAALVDIDLEVIRGLLGGDLREEARSWSTRT